MKDKSWSEGSNFTIDITSHGRDHLGLALDLALGRTEQVALYAAEQHVDDQEKPVGPAVMRFFWHPCRAPKWCGCDQKTLCGRQLTQALPLPFAMRQPALEELVAGWLETAHRGREPDLDGSVEPNGFRLQRGYLGNGNYLDSYELFRVTAVWTEFHK